MIKMLGAVMVLVAAFLLAHYINRKNEKKYERLVSFITLVRYIRKQIECYCLPVGEILQRCDAMLLESCGCADFDKSRIRPENAFGDFLQISEKTGYEKADRALLHFSSELGRGYREEQLRVCDYCISELEDTKREAEGELKKQKKLTYTLILSGAVMAVLLVI